MADRKDQNYQADMPRPKKKPVLPHDEPARTRQLSDRNDTQPIPVQRNNAYAAPPPVRRTSTAARSNSPAQHYAQTPRNAQYEYENEEDYEALPPPSGQRSSAPPRANRPASPVPPQRQAPRQAVPAPQQPKKRRKRRGLFSRLLSSLLVIAVLLFSIYSFVALRCIHKLDYVETGARHQQSSTLLQADSVKNVLLIGTDSRDATRGRSDSMILVSLNKKTNQIVLSSFMRDMYVAIPGHGNNKLNAAYSFGGAELLLDTLEDNFNIRIDDYVQVNFSSFAHIVDAVGGVEITITDKEAQAINQILHDEVNGLMGDPIDSDYLASGGTYVLNGKQALSYSRIRHVGNADFQRTQRQRDVITKMVQNMKGAGVSGVRTIMKEALPEMKTNMQTGELYWLSLRLPFLLGYDMQQQQIPAPNTYTGQSNEAGAVLAVDFAANRTLLQTTIYRET